MVVIWMCSKARSRTPLCRGASGFHGPWHQSDFHGAVQKKSPTRTVHEPWKWYGFGHYAVAGARCLSRSSAS